MGAKKTHEQFLKELSEKQPILFSKLKILGNYVNFDTYILVSYIYGNHLITPASLLLGQIPTIQSAVDKNEYFIKRAVEVHGEQYDYSLVNYVNNQSKVEIISEHGSFWQRPNSHLKGAGCPVKGLNRVKTALTSNAEEFINKARKVHGDLYDYSLVEYKNNHTKVKIISSEGIFKQTPREHLSGKGCPILGRNRTIQSAKENPTGWSYINWEKAALKSKNFDSFKVYIIKCWNDDKSEVFYKIGKTYTILKKRFKCKNDLPYQYQEIKIIEGSCQYICELEVKLKNQHTNYKYMPKLNFKGKYECFSELFNL